MKYKVGDTVTIRADLKEGDKTRLTVFLGMEKDAGKCVVIESISNSKHAFRYKVDGYWFSFDMIQPKTNKLFKLL